MTQLTREASIELGASVATGPLVTWATEQLSAARNHEGRLQHRGIHAGFLDEMRRLIDQVSDGPGTYGRDHRTTPPEVTQAQRVREEAFAFWQELKQIVKIEFGTRPEIQARFHLGVRTGRLIGNLVRELEADLSLLRHYAAELSWLGVDESFFRRGEVLMGRLRDAKNNLDNATRSMQPNVTEQTAKKGQLYDLTRKLVRCGQLEFIHEPELGSSFNYSALRKDVRGGSEIRLRLVKDAAV
jgi:hypothetical protein